MTAQMCSRSVRAVCAPHRASRTGRPRAQVAVRAERNEVLDQKSLIVRYQQQMAALRALLRRVSSAAGSNSSVHDPMHPEVCGLLHADREMQQPTPEWALASTSWPKFRVALTLVGFVRLSSPASFLPGCT